jgi:hypothetical protein
MAVLAMRQPVVVRDWNIAEGWLRCELKKHL